MGHEGLSTGEFAARAGVTVRTLRYYDRMGLLKPASRRRDGRRRYGPDELVRLQQIVTLKSLGFSLREIRSVLRQPGYDLSQALQTQRRHLLQRVHTLQAVVEAIDTAQRTLAPGKVDWESFVAIIRATHMAQEHADWIRQYYTDEQLQQLSARALTPEEQERVTATWQGINDDAARLAHAGADPAGPEAQAVAARAQEMIDAFTGGDPEIAASLQRVYEDQEGIPSEYRMGPTDEVTRRFYDSIMSLHRDRP